MGIGYRRFIVDDEGTLVQLRNTIFDRLLRDPQHHSMPALAGQRVRMAEILVQLADRRPIRVVRRVYFIVGFDEAGRLDTTRFLKQQWALAESALDRVLQYPATTTAYSTQHRDSLPRVADGNRQADLAQRIDDAALGRT